MFTIALLFGVLWGITENRLWKESGDPLSIFTGGHTLFGHLYSYHLFMAFLFGWVNSVTVVACSSINGVALSNPDNLVIWVILMLWDTFALDVAWWIIRWIDLTYPGQVIFGVGWLKYKTPLENGYDGGNGRAWHHIEDWDNAPIFGKRPPLVGIGKYKCYWWWWAFAWLIAGLYLLTFIV